MEAEPAPPQAHVEDGLGEGLALLPGEVAVLTEGAIQDALGGGACEDPREGLGGDSLKSGEGGPGLEAQASERIKPDC